MSEEGSNSTPTDDEAPRKANGTPVDYRPTARVKRRKSRIYWWIVLGALVLAVPIFFVGKNLLGIRTVYPQADALELPEFAEGEASFPHEVLDDVLSAYVLDGRVDYESLRENSDSLRRYAATLADVGPEENPERFTRREDRLAYYINAYNALVLLAVIEFWPIDTVLQVRGRIEPKAGSGFFWSLRFRLDGDSVSLYELEQGIIRKEFVDARFHAAINCASRGCPSLVSGAYFPDALDEQLDTAARRFASNGPHVRVDHEAREVVLSEIYDWYAEDFVAHVQHLEAGDTVLDWIRHYASAPVAEALATAKEQDYAIRYGDYDWHLNGL